MTIRHAAAAVFRWAVIVVTGLSGAALAAGGAWLITLHGSPYYLIAGAALIVTAALLGRRSAAGPWLYAVTFLATVAWSLFEVGLDGWALMPRLVYLGVLGLCIATPAVRGAERPPFAGRPLFVGALGLAAAAVAVGLWSGVRAIPSPEGREWSGRETAAASPAAADWVQYGGTFHGTRYSQAAQITPANAASLERAWTYRPGARNPGGKRLGSLEVTPTMADGLLYGCTAFDSVFALDPVTGKQVWRFNAGVSDLDGGHPVCRGVTFFRAPPGVTDCPTRLLLGTLSNQLIALDAKTGRLCRGFGEGGRVDLREGLGPFPRRWTHPTSPPTIVNGVAVIGAYVVDNQSTDAPSGVIRGYDAVTGQFRWAFDPGRPDDHGLPPPGKTYVRATPNSWTVASGDEQLGLVYLPMGNGSPDLYGGERTPETDRFSTAVVALDARTGQVRWVFQAVHHDLWDYDLAAQPALVDLPTTHGTVPALILPTKTGQVFVLDRRDGRPLTRVEERPAPQTDVPGERTSPTQPYSVGMPQFQGEPFSERDMWGVTPFDQLYCRIVFRQSRYDGMYTPPRLGKSIRYPGEIGGLDWGSVSVDEGRDILIVNSNHMADLDELITRGEAQREGLVPKLTADVHSAPGGPMTGTPYGIHWGGFLTALGVPCQRPPYGFLAAVDLRTHQLIWRRPLGDARNSGPVGIHLGLPIPLGSPNIGGSAVTRGGVVFIAATQDEMFRAVDELTGRVLWQDHLPAAGHATPMTYVGPNGAQYVVIAAGGGNLRDKPGDYLIAYRLRR